MFLKLCIPLPPSPNARVWCSDILFESYFLRSFFMVPYFSIFGNITENLW